MNLVVPVFQGFVRRKWYRKGAEKDYDCSEQSRRDVKSRGWVPKDYQEAANGIGWDRGNDARSKTLWRLVQRATRLSAGHRVYGKAANQGNVYRSRHGQMYYSGEGVPKDYVLSHMWLNLRPADCLAVLGLRFFGTPSSRCGTCLIEMTREQVADAQRLAREWKANRNGSEERSDVGDRDDNKNSIRTFS